MRFIAKDHETKTYNIAGNSGKEIDMKYCIVLFSFLGIIVFHGCNDSSEKASADKAGIAVEVILAENPVPLSSITIIAHEKGFFKAHGLDVSVRQFTSGKQSLDAVLGGGADFATVAETPIMHAGFVNQPVAVLATFTFSNNDCKVAARKDLGVTKPEDLKGMKVATFVGTSAEFFMNAFLKGHGLSAADVEVVTLKPPEMVSALVRGDIAAFFIWEPSIFMAEKALGDRAIVFTGEEFYTETFNLVTTMEYAQGNPDIAKKMLKALLDAEELIHNHPDEAIQIVSGYTGMEQLVLENIWPDFQFEIVLDPFLLKNMREQARWAIETGTAKGTSIPNYETMIYAVPLKQVKPEAVTIGKD